MDNNSGYYNDNGEKLDPNLISKPSLCTMCKKDDDPKEEILCDLNRLDQTDSEEFKCYVYEPKY